MLPLERARFNAAFTNEQYRAFLQSVYDTLGVPVEFRLSETPCFFSHELMTSLVDASLEMTHQLLNNTAYLAAADAMIPDRFRLTGGESMPTCVQVDFGLVRTDSGAVEGRLVELQAFPSLYGFQMVLGDIWERVMAEVSELPEVAEMGEGDGSRAVENSGPSSVSGGPGVFHSSRPVPFLSDLSKNEYVRLIRDTLVGPHDPNHVVLMEIEPHRQKTLPDFVATEMTWGIRAVDTREVIRDGRKLFYMRDGVRAPIARIYNRVIPDELERSGAVMPFDYRDELDVEWIGGPDWFFRISKFSIPWIKHPWVPETHFLSDVKDMPANRDEWLLKPLFSFAGGGIIFSPTDEDIAAIPLDQRHLYILQRRIAFTPVINTPAGPTQAELRIMLVRTGDTYRAVMPLIRMGRGKMMGVDHNKGMDFVGASAALIARPIAR